MRHQNWRKTCQLRGHKHLTPEQQWLANNLWGWSIYGRNPATWCLRCRQDIRESTVQAELDYLREKIMSALGVSQEQMDKYQPILRTPPAIRALGKSILSDVFKGMVMRDHLRKNFRPPHAHPDDCTCFWCREISSVAPADVLKEIPQLPEAQP